MDEQPIEKQCKDCKKVYPLTREYFGQYKNKRNEVVKINFRNSCRLCMAKNTAKHYKLHKDKLMKRLEKRKHLEENAEGNYTKNDIEKIRKNLQDKCFFCSKELLGFGDIEHLTPISRGGSNNPDNLMLSCSKCNKEKTNKTLAEYIAWRKERELDTRDIALFQNQKNLLN